MYIYISIKERRLQYSGIEMLFHVRDGILRKGVYMLQLTKKRMQTRICVLWFQHLDFLDQK